MVPVWWSIALTTVGLIGIVVAGGQRNPHWGWGIGVAAQALWLAYAIATAQWGFIASAVVVGTVNGWNMHRTRRRARP